MPLGRHPVTGTERGQRQDLVRHRIAGLDLEHTFPEVRATGTLLRALDDEGDWS